MQGFVRRALLFGFMFLFSAPGYGFIHESVRIRSLGTDFTSLIEDPYTDAFRNPAYLAKWDKAAFMTEVYDAQNGVFLGNLFVPLKSFRMSVAYQAHGHITGLSPADGRQFAGQRVTSDIYPELQYSSAREFQVIKAVLAKQVSRFNLGADIQYLKDWVFVGLTDDSINRVASRDFYDLFYTQLPTAFQIRTGAIYALESDKLFDVTFRYQRDRPRLEAARSGYDDVVYIDSVTYQPFRTIQLKNARSTGHLDEYKAEAALKYSLGENAFGGLLFSAERAKGLMPVRTSSYDTATSYYSGYFTGTTDSSITHFHWRYKLGVSATKDFKNKGLVSGGIVLAVTRTKEFVNTTIDSTVRIWQNYNLIRNRQKRLSSTGKKGLTFTEIALPMGAELSLTSNLQARFGIRPFVFVNNPDGRGHFADLSTTYTLGFGANLIQHFFIDTVVSSDVGDLQNWQIALRYVF